jgi:glycosyltransferase involved in cell wall biosynthesis
LKNRFPGYIINPVKKINSFRTAKEVIMKIALYAGIFKKDKDGATKSLYELTESLLVNGLEVGVQNIKIWSRGIHTDLYSPGFRSESLRNKWGAKNKKVILYCGRFVWYKDLETFNKKVCDTPLSQSPLIQANH